MIQGHIHKGHHMLEVRKKSYYLLFYCIEPCCQSRKQEVSGVLLVLHSKTIFEAGYHDQRSQKLC